MFFPKRPRSLRTHTTKAAKQNKRSRRRNRPNSGQIPRAVCCGPFVEELEGRQMLSGTIPPTPAVAAPNFPFVAKPTFVLFSHASTTGAQPSTMTPITPQQMQTAYGVNLISFNGIAGDGKGQTVAIVDAFNAPNIIADTKQFDDKYSLQPFNVAGGPTLQVLGQDGTTTLPSQTDVGGWEVEESLDVQWVHAIAPQANIILFEANTNGPGDMYATELSAAKNPAVTVVSNSWSGGEYSSETQDEASFFLTPVKHQGVTFLASTGDSGTPAGFPAYSRDVVAVGGTNLQIQPNGAYISESGWTGSGGGISQFEPIPSFQSGLNAVNGASTVFRNAPDVAADADPATGVSVYDSDSGGLIPLVGGTSLACPLWAGMIAIADQGRALAGLGSLNGATQTLPMLYSLPASDFNDVTTGSNGLNAGVGYDLVTGLGTPKANLLIPALAGYVPPTAPTVSAPSIAGVTENNPLVFSPVNGNSISFADSSGSTADTIQLSVSHGTLTLSSTTGLQVISGTDGSSSFTVSGTVANLDAALNGLTYQPTTAFLGADSLSLSFTDPVTSLSASATVSLTVVPAPSTTWTAMSQSVPNGDGGQLALLLPNGQLFVHGLGPNGDSPAWYLVTPDSTGGYVNGTWTTANPMNVGRLYFGSDVLPNGTVFVVGGEYSTDGGFSKTGEIYNIAANTWTTVTPSPLVNVGDEPTELLPSGKILVGDIQSNGTEIYDPSANTWSTGGAKVHTSDVSDEEPWVKLANGDILTYDMFSSVSDNQFEAELYNPTTNTWSDVSTSSNGSPLPLLSSPEQGYELGPALLLPDGRAMFTGATGLTVFFNPTNDTWTQGPTMPSVMINGALTQLTMGDAPGAVLPNGDVALALSPAVNIDSQGHENFPGPTYIYDFNPTANVYTDITPSSTVDPKLGTNTYINTMLVLPTGQLLLIDDNNQLAIYTPGGTPQKAWQPTVTSFTNNGNGTYTLTGSQLNGLDEGAAYGDDNQMAENYPIVQVTDTSTGHVYYATTSNWSTYGVATGGAAETVTVTMPTALGTDSFTLKVIADGIASNVFSQAPVFTVPNAVSVNQNSVLSFTGNNSISLSDNLVTGVEQVTLSVSNGTLDITSGLTITGNGSGNVVFSGAISDVNNALATLTYTPTIGFNGSDTLHLSDTDTTDGLNGAGIVAITVSPVAPSISVPAPVAVPMNSTLPFAGANLITVADISGTTEQMTLTVSHGILTLTTTGLTTVNGNGTASVTLGGAMATLNTDLATLVYTPTAGYSGGDTLSLSDKDTTDSLTGLASVPITVESAPTASGPSNATANENSTLTFSSANNNKLTVADPFADGAFGALTVSVSHGIVTLGSTSGVNITGGSNGSSSVTLTGTIDNLNAALNGLIYQPNTNFDNSDSLVVSLNNPADGLTGSSSVAISIDALAPAIAAPAAATDNANTPFVFSKANGNAISVSDINGGGDSLSLSAAHGTLTLAVTTGLTFTSGANGSSAFTVSGSLSSLDTALDGITYQPTLNYVGGDSLSLLITNLANNKSASTGVVLSIKAFPAVSAPSSAIVAQNSAVSFSPFTGNPINVTDLSAGTNFDSLTLSVTNGRLTVGSMTGLVFTSGSNNSASFTVTATIGAFEAALNGLTYQPNLNYTGSDSLSVLLADTGDGLSGTSSVALTVNPIVAPVITAPASVSLSENSSLTFSNAANSISVDDNGAGINADTETLSVSNGTLTLPNTTRLTFLAGSNGSAAFKIRGNVADFNAALNGLVYRPSTGFAGTDTLAISVADTADGKSTLGSVALNVIALPPLITAPQSGSLSLNGSLAFLPANANTISVTDANPVTDSLTLSVGHGTLTLASVVGLSFGTGTNGSASFTVSGAVPNLNAALNGLVYRPTSGYSGSDSLTITVLDSGDSQSATAHVSLSISTPAPPSINAPLTATIAQNGALVFTSANSNAITVIDAAAGANTDSLTLSVAHGTLTLATTSGLSFTTGTNGTASFVVTGSVANLNAALNGLVYRPAAGYLGSDSFSLSVLDSGDNESGPAIVAITVTGSSAPTITAPTGSVVSENGALAFSAATSNAIVVADSGPGSNSDSLTLSASHGTVSLGSTSGLTITAGANGSSSITVTGSVANLDAALTGLIYQPTTGYIGSDSLVIFINDTVDKQSATANVSLAVNAGTAPSIKAPATVATKSSTVVFSNSAIAVTDNNAGTSLQELSLKTTSGTLKLASIAGITFISGANNSASMLIEGTLANLNAALNGLSLTMASKTATVILAYVDLGNNLSGTAAINVSQGGGFGLNTVAATGTSAGPTTSTASTSSMPPDSETQWKGVTAAMQVLGG